MWGTVASSSTSSLVSAKPRIVASQLTPPWRPGGPDGDRRERKQQQGRREECDWTIVRVVLPSPGDTVLRSHPLPPHHSTNQEFPEVRMGAMGP